MFGVYRHSSYPLNVHRVMIVFMLPYPQAIIIYVLSLLLLFQVIIHLFKELSQLVRMILSGSVQSVACPNSMVRIS